MNDQKTTDHRQQTCPPFKGDGRAKRARGIEGAPATARQRTTIERGSIGLGVALIGVVLVFILGVGLVGAAASTYAVAATAADAAALASAPVTFRPFGARGSPRDEAARFAMANGARLVRCDCPVDRSWATRTVSVTVSRRITLPVIGGLTIEATSRAVFEPSALLLP